MTSPLPLEQDFGRLTMSLLADFQRRLDTDLASRGVSGVSRRYRGVLIHLGQTGGARNVDLATAAGIRPQSMMKIVHELEELGLVLRATDPEDSRAKLITFTSRGQALIAELAKSTEAVWQSYCEILGEQSLTQVFSDISRLLDASRSIDET